MSLIELNKDTFQDAITEGGTVIIDFWAPWCGPCKNFGPVFEKAAEKHDGITFAKVNTDEQQELAGALGIRSIPGALSAGQFDELIGKIQEIDMADVHKQIAEAQTPASENNAS
jgi:thioredoxin 2